MARRASVKKAPKWPTLRYERKLWAQGFVYVAGADEVGRGALAGPVYSAAVILPDDKWIGRELKGVRDSKQMTPEERSEWAPRIKQLALAWAIGYAEVNEIDEINILQASYLSTERAIAALAIQPQHLLLDFIKLTRVNLPQTSLVDGDARSLSISAASVIAKVVRDAKLIELDAAFPHYGFASHKGYATEEHFAALAAYGPCPQHRSSFSPMRLTAA